MASIPASKRTYLDPPASLSKESASMWKRLTMTFQLDDDASLMLLQSALEARDRAQAARELIKKKGLTLLDRYGTSRPNPACTIMRDAESSMRHSLRLLNLEIEAPQERPGRPKLP